MFSAVRRATRLKMNIAKIELVYFGADGLAEISGAMEELMAGERLTATGRGIHLGVPIGPEASRVCRDKVTAKIRRATRHIGDLHITVSVV